MEPITMTIGLTYVLKSLGLYLATTQVRNLGESFVDNVFLDKVKKPKVGSVVYCDLCFGTAEHSGIYVGNNKIVHLNSNGCIEKVSPKEFIDRMNGFNSAMNIYVSCDENCQPVGSQTAAQRARKLVGKMMNYSLILNNCHDFTAGCVTGDFYNGATFLWMMKFEAEKKMGVSKWRVWDLDLFG